MSTTRVRPSVRAEWAAGLSGDYRDSADGLLWRAKMYRFMFLFATFASLAGMTIYGVGMLDMSYRNYPGDLYHSFKWWMHPITLAAMTLGIITSVTYMQQGGRWSRFFAVVGTLGSLGWMIFGVGVYGWILCECDNIGGAPPGLLHPECPDITGEPRAAFVYRGWAQIGMSISMAITAGIVVFVINNVGELLALIKRQQEEASASSTESMIGKEIEVSDKYHPDMAPHIFTKYSSSAHAVLVASQLVHQASLKDIEKQSFSVSEGYTLAR